MAPSNKKRDLRGNLKDAVFEGLEFLGPVARDALLINLEEKYSIDLSKDDGQIDEVEKVLKEIFGSSATVMIERIRQRLDS